MKHIQIGYAGMSPLIFLLPPPRLDPQELEIDHGFDHITFHIFSPSWLSTWCSNKTPEPVMTNLLPRHDHSNPQIHHVHLRLGYPNRQPSWPKSTWAACRCFMMLVDLGMLDESVIATCTGGHHIWVIRSYGRSFSNKNIAAKFYSEEQKFQRAYSRSIDINFKNDIYI